MGLGEAGNEWRADWEELKEAVRTGTWESFESKLNEHQQEVVRLIGKFNAFYGIEEPKTEFLYEGAWKLIEERRTRCSISTKD